MQHSHFLLLVRSWHSLFPLRTTAISESQAELFASGFSRTHGQTPGTPGGNWVTEVSRVEFSGRLMPAAPEGRFFLLSNKAFCWLTWCPALFSFLFFFFFPGEKRQKCRRWGRGGVSPSRVPPRCRPALPAPARPSSAPAVTKRWPPAPPPGGRGRGTPAPPAPPRPGHVGATSRRRRGGRFRPGGGGGGRAAAAGASSAVRAEPSRHELLAGRHGRPQRRAAAFRRRDGERGCVAARPGLTAAAGWAGVAGPRRELGGRRGAARAALPQGSVRGPRWGVPGGRTTAALRRARAADTAAVPAGRLLAGAAPGLGAPSAVRGRRLGFVGVGAVPRCAGRDGSRCPRVGR